MMLLVLIMSLHADFSCHRALHWEIPRLGQATHDAAPFAYLHNRFSSFLIQWALICGDARISLAALEPFLFPNLPFRPKAALAAIRSSYICLSLIFTEPFV
jgi:hypothetical protein